MSVTLECHMLDGSPVTVTMRDLGLRDRCLRGRHFPVYVTQIAVRNRKAYSRVAKDLLDRERDATAYRRRADLIVVASLGVGVRDLL